MDIYYRKDGRYNGRLNLSESFRIVQKENQHNLLLLSLSSTPFEDREASILIDFPHASNDTLDIQAKGNDGELYATQLWHNSKLIWSNGENKRHFNIMKMVSSN